MNNQERIAWRSLISLGAQLTSFCGQHALDLSTIRVRSRRNIIRLCSALSEVTGSSGRNRREYGTNGAFIITDDSTPPGVA